LIQIDLGHFGMIEIRLIFNLIFTINVISHILSKIVLT